MQMSDWGRRPLSSRQLTYAALDAFVLLQIVEAITQGGSALSQQQLQQFLFTCSAQNPQTSSQHSMSQPTTPNKDHKALLSGGKADRKRNPVNAAEAGDKKISHSPAEPSTLPAGATAMHLSPAAAEHAWSNTPSDLQQRKGRYRQQASPAMSLARQQRYPPYGLCPPPGAHADCVLTC